MGDQASERFEKKWAMSAIEFHWEAHKKQCALEDAALEAETKALPDKLQEVTAELTELTRKVGSRGWQLGRQPGGAEDVLGGAGLVCGRAELGDSWGAGLLRVFVERPFKGPGVCLLRPLPLPVCRPLHPLCLTAPLCAARPCSRSRHTASRCPEARVAR